MKPDLSIVGSRNRTRFGVIILAFKFKLKSQRRAKSRNTSELIDQTVVPSVKFQLLSDMFDLKNDIIGA